MIHDNLLPILKIIRAFRCDHDKVFRNHSDWERRDLSCNDIGQMYLVVDARTLKSDASIGFKMWCRLTCPPVMW